MISEILSVAFVLILILALIILSIFLLKKYQKIGEKEHTSSIKIISQCSIGYKERLIIVQADHLTLILGVAPNVINLLHVMEK